MALRWRNDDATMTLTIQKSLCRLCSEGEDWRQRFGMVAVGGLDYNSDLA